MSGWPSTCVATLTPVWIDADGVAHSVAVPDPSDLMSSTFQSALDALLVTDREAVVLTLEQVETRLFAQDLTALADPEKEAVFEGLAPPGLLLDGHVSTPGDVRAVVECVEWRWRLDVICALDDYID